MKSRYQHQREKLNFIILKGGIVCSLIRDVFYPQDKWNMETAKKVAKKFTELKVIAKPFYPNATEEQFVEELSKYTPRDIQEAFEQKS